MLTVSFLQLPPYLKQLGNAMNTIRTLVHSSVVLLAAQLLTNAAGAAEAPAPGQTLRLVATSAAGTLDPHINYETGQYWPIAYILNDGLLTFKKVEGAASNEVVPDLAEALPHVSPDGKTYEFKLRSDVMFSNGQKLKPTDVLASFQRLFKVNNPNAGSWYNGIVGADACLKTPASCTLDGGVIIDDASNKVTINLTAPDSEFLYKLAVPFGSILPANTVASDLGNTPPVATGPYMITTYNPQREMVLERNPYFKQWSEAAQPQGLPDKIVYTFGVQPNDAVTAIANGQQDWMYDNPPADRLKEMSTRYASQIHINPMFAIYAAELNVNIPPFNNKDARLALNYAVNRRSVVNVVGGAKLATPNCQILPIGFPGFRPYCPYTLNPGDKWSAPDMAKAKALMVQSGQTGQKVTLVVGDGGSNVAIGTYLVSVMNELGLDAALKVISSNIQWTYVQNSKNNVQATTNTLFQDYPAASDILHVLLSCSAFNPGSDSSPNVSGYCSKSLDEKMKQAISLSLTDPVAANDLWAQIDKQATDDAPWVTLFSPQQLDFISSRVKNFPYSYQSRVLFSRVSLN
jgi:peptide/nickel transport system substrate-binding protein